MSTAPKYTWFKIAESPAEINFPESGLTEIEINGKIICIAKHHDRLFACTQKCPHAGGILAKGYIDALGNIVCPVHRYKFNPANGANISGEGYHLKTFTVEEREDGLYIKLNNASFSGEN